MQHPWFRTSMPKGMDMLNYNLVQSLARPGLQSVEEIEQVVQAATKLGAAWNGEPGSGIRCFSQLGMLTLYVHTPEQAFTAAER